MKINNTFILFVVLLPQVVLGQSVDSKRIQGKISFDSVLVEGVNVVNLMTKKSTTSDKEGLFFLFVKQGDILVFSSINLETLRKVVAEEDFGNFILEIKMVQKNNQLKEVIINKNSNINEVSLGIVSKNKKTYTPAERKLRTAGDFKPIMLLGLIGGSMPLDPLINKINGRTKRLKKEVVLERKELNLKYLDVLFQENYFVDDLKIPSEYVGGFKYYVVENEEFVLALKDKKEPIIKLLLAELAVKYIEVIACENE
ncbi:hypothetical protein QO200_02330 [Flavobacterium sp. Arc3]|uniref:hypothetical protein n=1 Tax=Flavobacterium sp. Arc3 TaxID=3046686 RepID=UPI00352C8135